jgi:hypothetical protein
MISTVEAKIFVNFLPQHSFQISESGSRPVESSDASGD